jgi:glycosyltransferase involved in cell wall biosynthesis
MNCVAPDHIPRSPANPEVHFAGKTLLCLATQEWDAHWTPVQQVMLRLAPHNRIIYFEPFHPPLAWAKRGNELLRRQRAARVPRLREVHPNLFVYRPRELYAPFHLRSRLAARINARLYKSEIRSLLGRMNANRPWLWAFFAQSLSVLELPFEQVVYDCVDYWPGFFPNTKERDYVSLVDTELCRRANLVFTGSEPMRLRQLNLNPRTFTIPHAADIPHFLKASDPETMVPAELADIPHPRIGFVGMMDAVRFDSDLIRTLAANTAHHLVFVGGFAGGAHDLLPARDNVHWLGMKSISQLPAYLKGMDVCIMPYRLNEATRNIYPLKLHEYLATGKPVVSTAISAVQDFRELIYVAENHRGFASLLQTALQERDDQLRERRQSCARQHTWDAHVAAKVKVIQEHLGESRFQPAQPFGRIA